MIGARPGSPLGPSSRDSGELDLCASPVGQHAYKFLLDGQRWLDDPNNPRKAPDGVGGLNSALVVPEAARPRVSENDKQLEMGATQIRS